MRPIIGITCNYTYDGSGPFAEGIGTREQEWQLLADDYITAIEQAGGLPLIIPIYRALSSMEEALSHVDGVIISGGNDIDSNLFGQFPAKEVGKIVSQRDRQDIALAKLVLQEMKLPVLGVCRGIQVMNVAMGGTLHQHLPAAGYNTHSLSMYRRNEGSHKVSIQKDSMLYEIYGAESAFVNSFHHQAVAEPAAAFRVTAVSPDGVTEAIEMPGADRFVLGVQWHPEMLSSGDEFSRRLLKRFVDACRQTGEL